MCTVNNSYAFAHIANHRKNSYHRETYLHLPCDRILVSNQQFCPAYLTPPTLVRCSQPTSNIRSIEQTYETITVPVLLALASTWCINCSRHKHLILSLLHTPILILIWSCLLTTLCSGTKFTRAQCLAIVLVYPMTSENL